MKRYAVQVHNGEEWYTVRDCETRAQAETLACAGGFQEDGPVRVKAYTEGESVSAVPGGGDSESGAHGFVMPGS